MGGSRQGPMKASPIKRTLACTLEELATGCSKRVKVTRQREGRPEEKVLEITVKPGWKKGTTVTFENEGDESPGILPADLQFVIGEKEHDRFTREGDNLILNTRVSLGDALGGTTLAVKTLDGRVLNLNVTEIITPNYTKTIKGEGMPKSKVGGKGDLLIRFNIAFPLSLPEEKRRQIKALLS